MANETSETRPPLTERQHEILDFVRDSIEANGWAPTVREIADAFSFTSPNGAATHLRALETKGYIFRAKNQSRAIRIIT